MAALDLQASAGSWLSFAASSAAQAAEWVAAGGQAAAGQALGADFLAALDAVCRQGLAAVAALDLLRRAQSDVRREHVTRFWAQLRDVRKEGEEEGEGAGATLQAVLLEALKVTACGARVVARAAGSRRRGCNRLVRRWGVPRLGLVAPTCCRACARW